jgi:hypothetical protein
MDRFLADQVILDCRRGYLFHPVLAFSSPPQPFVQLLCSDPCCSGYSCMHRLSVWASMTPIQMITPEVMQIRLTTENIIHRNVF